LPPALQPQPQPATNIFMCHECFILLKWISKATIKETKLGGDITKGGLGPEERGRGKGTRGPLAGKTAFYPVGRRTKIHE
jgi:hypothetical protein